MSRSINFLIAAIVGLVVSGCRDEEQKPVKRSIRGVSTGQTVEQAEAAVTKRGGKCYLRKREDTIPPTSIYCIFKDDARLELLIAEHIKPQKVYHMNYVYRVDRPQETEFEDLSKHLDLQPTDPEKEGPIPKYLVSGEDFYFNCSIANIWHDNGCEINIQDDKIHDADIEMKENLRKKLPAPDFE